MTVNERLFLSGLLERYEKAVAAWDVDEISEVLKSIYLNTETIDAIISIRVRKEINGTSIKKEDSRVNCLHR